MKIVIEMPNGASAEVEDAVTFDFVNAAADVVQVFTPGGVNIYRGYIGIHVEFSEEDKATLASVQADAAVNNSKLKI